MAGAPAGRNDEVTLADQSECSDRAHEGNDRADDHQVVQRGGEADVVGVEEIGGVYRGHGGPPYTVL